MFGCLFGNHLDVCAVGPAVERQPDGRGHHVVHVLERETRRVARKLGLLQPVADGFGFRVVIVENLGQHRKQDIGEVPLALAANFRVRVQALLDPGRSPPGGAGDEDDFLSNNWARRSWLFRYSSMVGRHLPARMLAPQPVNPYSARRIQEVVYAYGQRR